MLCEIVGGIWKSELKRAILSGNGGKQQPTLATFLDVFFWRRMTLSEGRGVPLRTIIGHQYAARFFLSLFWGCEVIERVQRVRRGLGLALARCGE